MMKSYQAKGHTLQKFIITTCLLSLTLLLISWSHFSQASASDLQWRGLVSAMPSSGLVGNWTIGGRAFISTSSTRYDTENGVFALGVCVDVDYQESGSGNLATRLSTKAQGECASSTGTGTTTGTPGATTTGTPEATTTGTTTGTPRATTTGTTTGTPGATTTGTTTGTPGATTTGTTTGTPGATTTGTTTGTPAATTTGTTTAVATPSVTTTGTPENCGLSRQASSCKHFGRITALPQNGLVGTWTVGTVTYLVSEQTRLETDYGQFAVGVCVEVKYRLEGSTRIADEIESEKSYLCGSTNNSGQRAEALLYGVLESFPAPAAGTISPGTWVIGGMSFAADASTQLKQSNGSFAPGITVKIKFYTSDDGVNHALEIESRFENEQSGNDDNGNGSHDGAEGMVLGSIESIPANRQGVWRIDGIDYSANADTEFEEENGNLAVGARVRMRYHLASNNLRIADNIKTIAAAGQVEPGEDAHLAGFVKEMPATGFVGRWVVSNVVFEATTTTRFQEENGLLALGAYVAVEYRVVNGVNQIVELKSQVPPGAGDSNGAGKIEQVGASSAVRSNQATTTWRIGGVNYLVTEATLLNADQADLTVGNTATVNSYRDASGNQVATKLQGIQLTQSLSLPLVRR